MLQTPAAQHLCTKVAGNTLLVVVVAAAVIVFAVAVADTDSATAGKLQDSAAVTAGA